MGMASVPNVFEIPYSALTFLDREPNGAAECSGIDMPGLGRVHGEFCACGGRLRPHVDERAALPQPLDRFTAALDELEAVSGELGFEDALAVLARRFTSARRESIYCMSRGGESVRCLECGYAHGNHAEGCIVAAMQHLLRLVRNKRVQSNL